MKKLMMSALVIGLIGLSACEKEEDTTPDNNNGGNGNGNGSVSVTNNSVVAGSESSALNKGTAYISNDANTGNDYLTLYFYLDNVGNGSNVLSIILDENLPSASTTLSWQSGSSNPGDIGPSEFVAQVKVNDESWYGPFTGNGYDTQGDCVVNISGGKISFAFEDIEMGDDLIQVNVTSTTNTGAKVTMNLADLQDVLAGNSSEFSLVAE